MIVMFYAITAATTNNFLGTSTLGHPISYIQRETLQKRKASSFRKNIQGPQACCLITQSNRKSTPMKLIQGLCEIRPPFT